jgi:Flp pilus assembly protein TadG
VAERVSIFRRLRRREDGVLAVELAILFPILAVILFGIIEFGITVYGEEQWVSAARDGARYVAVRCAPDAPSSTGCTTALIEQRIANTMCNGTVSGCFTPGTPTVYFGNAAVAANYCTTPGNIGKLVTLKWVQHVHTIAVPILGSWPVNPTVTGSFRCE